VSTVFLTLKLLAALLGLVIPGYALARSLRLQHSLFAAFPFSALIICHSVTVLAIFKCSITFPVIATILAAITAICGIPVLFRKSPEDMSITGNNPDNPWFKPALAAALLLILITAFRTSLYPLGGFDTFTRWDALAREMLKYASLSFYPPVTGSDFSIYTMPDGFPPLVASVYWWIYAATGTDLPQFTAISVTLQLASILGLTWAATETAFGKRAACFSLLSLSASPLLVRSVEMGQESGFLALATAGQICFTLAAIRRPAPGPVYAAAIFAALGALAREYGPVLALPGLFVLLSSRDTRRLAWRYALLAAIVASPWYIRNWVIAGSPLYPMFMPGSASINEFLATLMRYYESIFGLSSFGAKDWFFVGRELITGGSVALLAIPFLFIKGRKTAHWALSLAIITVFWLWSIGKTSGGVLYSMRVLAPAVVILAIVTGDALDRLDKEPWRRVSWLLIPAALWGILSALSFPLQTGQLSAALLSTKGEAPEFCEANREFARGIEALDTPATGVLTDSPYLAVILKRETRFRPVIVWSSEVSPILSTKQGLLETAKLLQGKGVSLVALNRSSIHNELLFRIPFYRDGVNEWRELSAVGDWVLFAINPIETSR